MNFKNNMLLPSVYYCLLSAIKDTFLTTIPVIVQPNEVRFRFSKAGIDIIYIYIHTHICIYTRDSHAKSNNISLLFL